jgi:hypothetical protein
MSLPREPAAEQCVRRRRRFTLERALCHCSGADPSCPDCNGTGTVEKVAGPVRGCPWVVNVFVPEGIPYYECHPSSHVRCRYCGRRIKRRKVWEHVQQEHSDAEQGRKADQPRD